jgi:hypothetical protein
VAQCVPMKPLGDEFIEWASAHDSPLAPLTFAQVMTLRFAINSFEDEQSARWRRHQEPEAAE